jgi:hypothetical protein
MYGLQHILKEQKRTDKEQGMLAVLITLTRSGETSSSTVNMPMYALQYQPLWM